MNKNEQVYEIEYEVEITETRRETFKVGDKVTIVKKLKSYTFYDEWVAKNVKKKIDIARYAYGDFVMDGCEYGRILAIAPYSKNNDTLLAYVQTKGIRKCYLVELSALKKGW